MILLASVIGAIKNEVSLSKNTFFILVDAGQTGSHALLIEYVSSTYSNALWGLIWQMLILSRKLDSWVVNRYEQ